MNTQYLFKAGIFFLLIFTIISCGKYLDAKPDKQQTLPSTFNDLQALLDNYTQMNSTSYPSSSEFLADDSYIDPLYLGSFDNETKDFYLWQAQSTNQNLSSDWVGAYRGVLITNTILENIDNAEGREDVMRKNSIKGTALFLRAYYFHAIAELFTKPFDSQTAAADPGIPIRLVSDINIVSARATIKQSYEQILKDLKETLILLPEKVLVKSRPNLAAAYGALARVYLSMKAYDSAGFYADKCLQLHNDLLNFNDLTVDAPIPFERFNKEVIFQMRGNWNSLLSYPFAAIDTNLYNSYADEDLRKEAYFDKQATGIYFKGDYDGRGIYEGYVFSSIVTDEMYLIRAECNARASKLNEAMNDLNHLLKTRWDNTVTYVNISATDRTDAIKKILAERRKELVKRGTRWTDLRRLQNEPDFAEVPKRIVDGQTYELPVNSSKYVLKIPQIVINETGMEQNP